MAIALMGCSSEVKPEPEGCEQSNFIIKQVYFSPQTGYNMRPPRWDVRGLDYKGRLSTKVFYEPVAVNDLFVNCIN